MGEMKVNKDSLGILVHGYGEGGCCVTQALVSYRCQRCGLIHTEVRVCIDCGALIGAGDSCDGEPRSRLPVPLVEALVSKAREGASAAAVVLGLTTVPERFEEIDAELEQLKATRPDATQLELLDEATRRVLGHPASYEDVAAFMECISERMQRTAGEIDRLRQEMRVH